jgi:hypothetical protein
MHSRSRPGKRLRPKGVKPLALTTLTHFQLFLQRPRAPKKESKWKPKWNLRVVKNTKNPETRTLEKNSQLMRPQKVGLWTPWRGVREWVVFVRKTDNSSRNRPYRPQGIQNDCPASKMMENFSTLLVKNKTLAVKKSRRSKQTKKWHGGG